MKIDFATNLHDHLHINQPWVTAKFLAQYHPFTILHLINTDKVQTFIPRLYQPLTQLECCVLTILRPLLFVKPYIQYFVVRLLILGFTRLVLLRYALGVSNLRELKFNLNLQ